MHLSTLGLRRVSLVAAVLLGTGCVLNRQASEPFDGCWAENPPTDYIVRSAANAIIGDKGAGGPRIRALAAMPLYVDSIRRHSELVTDRAICVRAWRALDPSDRRPRVAVVRIGHTYWVRLPSGLQAFDDDWRLLTNIVDL